MFLNKMNHQDYEIIHLENLVGFRGDIEKAAVERGFHYKGVGCLEDLKPYLDKKNKRIFLLDDNFPRLPKGKNLTFLAREAISMIKKNCPDAKVFMYASEAEHIAWQNGIEYFDKSGWHTPKSVIDGIVESLEAKTSQILIVNLDS